MVREHAGDRADLSVNAPCPPGIEAELVPLSVFARMADEP